MRLWALIMLMGLGTCVACLGESDSQAPTAPRGEIPDVRLQRAEFTEVKDGAKLWHLRARQVEYQRGSGQGRLSGGVEVTFYPEKGEPLEVTSERGTFDSKAKEIELTGNVRGVAAPYHFYSQSLRYLPRQRQLTTNEAARLESPGVRVEGRGLSYDLERRQFRIGSHVQATSSQRLF